MDTHFYCCPNCGHQDVGPADAACSSCGEPIPMDLDGVAIAELEERFSVLRFVRFGHLRDEHLRHISRPFALLAYTVATDWHRDAEVSAALRKIREAKDAIVGLAAVTAADRDALELEGKR